VFVSATVVGSSGFGTPTGMVTFTPAAGSIPNGASPGLNSQGTASVQSNPFVINGPAAPFDAGQYSISATYAGDASFQTSSSTQPVVFTIQPGFFAALPASQSTVTISAPGSSGSTSVVVSSSTGFSGTITLACSGLPAGAACQFSPSSIKATGTATNTASTITVTTSSGVAAMLRPSVRPSLGGWLAAGSLMFFSIVLISGQGRRRLLPFLLTLVALILLTPGCGGGGGSHPPPPPPPTPATLAGTYNISVTASSGSIASTTGFTLVVQ